MLYYKFFQKNQPELQPVLIPSECPNCWGYSQWDNMDCPITLNIDKGSPREIWSKNGFIRRFVKKYLG